jgi:SAM-dependent methyltransferase
VKSSNFKTVDWYDRPDYYDILLAQDTQVEADFIEAVLQTYGRKNGRRLLEPACGSGRLVVELARRGYPLSGFDLSEPMLAYARQQLDREKLSAELLHASLEGFQLKHRVDLIYCLLSSFRYLMDDKSALEHLRRSAKCLTKGGIYILGLHLSEYDFKLKQHERWVAERDQLKVICNLRSWPVERKARTERLRSRITASDISRPKSPKLVDKIETEWDFRSYDEKQLKALLSRVPEFDHIATYDFTYSMDSPRSLSDEHLDNVLILRKR